MENIAGKYKFDGQENFDEFLKAQGNIFFHYFKVFLFFKYVSILRYRHDKAKSGG